MLDRNKIGHQFPAFQVTIEKGMLRLFARAIGETNPVYTDEAAAREAGYASLPIPLTYPFCLGKFIDDPFDTLHLFNLDHSNIVHGEQEFHYSAAVCAGDILTGQKSVTDVYDRRNGALEFIVVTTEFKDASGLPVCRAIQTIVVDNKSGNQS